jgi:hypothetical protein
LTLQIDFWKGGLRARFFILGNSIGKCQHSSSPGLIERSGIPERAADCGVQDEHRVVLDAPAKPRHDESKL